MYCLFYDFQLFVICCVPGIAPFHVEVCVDGDREILVRHLRYKKKLCVLKRFFTDYFINGQTKTLDVSFSFLWINVGIIFYKSEPWLCTLSIM
jgi:hypothetical protein